MAADEALEKKRSTEHSDSMSRGSMTGNILDFLNEDIAFYRRRTHQALVLFAFSAIAITALAEYAKVALLTRAGLAAVLVFGSRTVVEIFRTSTVRSKYVKLVRRTLLKWAQRFLEPGMELTPVTIDIEFDEKKQSRLQKSAGSNTRQYERLAWMIASSLILILADPLLEALWDFLAWS